MKRTKKDFEKFKKFCLEYQRKFELTGWHMFFEFKDLDDRAACTVMNLEAMNVTIGLSTKLTGLDKSVKNLAKHEVLHVLLGRMGELAQYRYTTFRELDAAEHDIINKLIKLIPD